jgi:hypothetical protein
MTAPTPEPIALEILPLVDHDGGNVLSIDLSAAINAAHATATTVANQVSDKARQAIAAAIECGELLNRQKGSLSFGGWLPWLAIHCPEISVATARRYMRLSKRSGLIDLTNSANLHQAYFATGILSEPASREAAQPDANTPVIKFTKGLDQFRRWYHRRTDDTPVAKWTPEARRLLRQELTWFKNLYDDLAA